MKTTSELRRDFAAWKGRLGPQFGTVLLLRRSGACFVALVASGDAKLQVYFKLVGSSSPAYVECVSLAPVVGKAPSSASQGKPATAGFSGFTPNERYSHCADADAVRYDDGSPLVVGVTYHVTVAIKALAERYVFSGTLYYGKPMSA